MGEADRIKWDQRYLEGDRVHDGPPSWLLERWLPVFPKGKALDVACGLGRNALLLARHGYEVDAVDISPVAIEEASRRARSAGLDVHFVTADLDTYPLADGSYDLVVNTYFLKRDLIPTLKRALKPGGFIVFETHVRSEEEVFGPKEPSHLLEPNELLHLFWDFHILFYEETLEGHGKGRQAVARLVARKVRG